VDLGHFQCLPRGLIYRELTVILREKDLFEFLKREYTVLLYVMHIKNLLDFHVFQGLSCLRKGFLEVGRCDEAAVVCIEVLKEGRKLFLG